MNHLSMHIRQPEVPSRMAESQLLMIEAEQLENRGVQIVNVNLLLRCGETKFIRRAMHVTAAHAASSHPHREPVMIVVAPVDLARV